MSKKSLLYIIIIIFVLTSGFFLASNYKSSIEMKNRGENIVPSVNDNKDIVTKQYDIQFSHSMGDACPEDYQVWNEEHTEFTCRCDSEIIYDNVCYNSQEEYCSETGQGDAYVPDHGCMTSTTDAYCSATNQGDKYVSGYGCMTSTTDAYCSATNQGDKYVTGHGCMTSTTDAYCSATNQGDKYVTGHGCMTSTTDAYCKAVNNDNYVYVQSKNSCMDSTTDAYCSAVNLGDKYVPGNGCMTSTTDAYCSATNQGDKYVPGRGCMTSTTDAYCSATNQGDKYVPGRGCMTSTTDAYCSATNQGDKYVPGYGCMSSTTDAYCIATKGTHYSGGGCRNNQDECVALEDVGAKYRGTDDEKYNASKCDSLTDQCSRDGKFLYGGKCITYKQKCEEVSKGTWKNGTCITNNNGGNGVSGKTSNKDKNDNPKTDDVIGTTASLSDIVLSSGRLMFTPGILDYRVEVSSNVESITIEPITTDPDATFVVNGDTKLKPGENPFTIVVTAEDGKTTLTYNVIIVRTDRILSSNSKASLIEITNHEINFDKDQTDYEVDLTIDEDELDIKVTAEDNLSITEIFGNAGLQNGDIVTVKLTAEDGSYTVYAIKVNKEEPFNIKDYIPYIIAGVAGLLLIIVGAAILRGRKSNDSGDEEEDFDSKKDKIKDDDKDDFKMKSKD